jgi:hypothetical protein
VDHVEERERERGAEAVTTSDAIEVVLAVAGFVSFVILFGRRLLLARSRRDSSNERRLAFVDLVLVFAALEVVLDVFYDALGHPPGILPLLVTITRGALAIGGLALVLSMDPVLAGRQAATGSAGAPGGPGGAGGGGGVGGLGGRGAKGEEGVGGQGGTGGSGGHGGAGAPGGQGGTGGTGGKS